VYVNLQWMRRANILRELPPVPPDPDYQQFIDATGFQFERDLDEAAVAIHYPASLPVTTIDAAKQARFSEVFTGKIQGERLNAYLRKISSSVVNYHDIDIYSIPLEGRTVRVAILGVDTVAASNHPDPQLIRGIVDRSRKLASPFAGPALLRQYYKEVPFASLAWAIVRIVPASAAETGPASWSFLFSKPAVAVASLRYLRAVHLRTVAFTNNEEDAQQLAERLETFLNVFHTAENTVSTSGADADVKAFFDSLKVEHQKNRALLTATIPQGFIRKVFAEAPAAVTPSGTPPPNSPSVPANPATTSHK